MRRSVAPIVLTAMAHDHHQGKLPVGAIDGHLQMALPTDKVVVATPVLLATRGWPKQCKGSAAKPFQPTDIIIICRNTGCGQSDLSKYACIRGADPHETKSRWPRSVMRFRPDCIALSIRMSCTSTSRTLYYFKIF